jgi:hypothetical protein
VTYELWDEDSGNRIGGYESLAGAVQVVREIAELSGLEAVSDLFVEVWLVDAPSPSTILRGAILRQFAQPLVRTYRLASEVESPTSATSTSQTFRKDLAVAV